MQSECGQGHAFIQNMEDHTYGFAAHIELPRAIHRFGMKWAVCKQSGSRKSQLRRLNFGPQAKIQQHIPNIKKS